MKHRWPGREHRKEGPCGHRASRGQTLRFQRAASPQAIDVAQTSASLQKQMHRERVLRQRGCFSRVESRHQTFHNRQSHSHHETNSYRPRSLQSSAFPRTRHRCQTTRSYGRQTYASQLMSGCQMRRTMWLHCPRDQIQTYPPC